MYVPQSFEVTDLHRLHEFIEQHGFATLVSQHGDEPFATHLPILLDRHAGSNGTLIGHMAKANPQWQRAQGQKVLTIFQGPHTYVSPTWYQSVNVVPTWNYVAVHAYGTLKLETNRPRLLAIVRQYVDFYEAGLPQPWSLDNAQPDFIDGLLDAIVGFEIAIDQIEGKWKLNQNQDQDRQKKVIRALQETGTESERRIAALMSQNLEE